MRHENISNFEPRARVEVAVWPTGLQVVPIEIAEVQEVEQPQRPTAAAPDVPAAVGKMVAAAYVMLVSAFALATVASAYSVFMIAISFLFLVAFFSVPWIFLKTQPKCGRARSLDCFMAEGMMTLTGHSSGPAALVQMLIVPVFLTFAVIAMGVAAAIIM